MPTGRDEHHVGLLGQRVEHPLQRDIDGGVDVVEGAAEHARRGGVEAVGRELRQVPELVPGDVGGAERQPREVERLLAQVQRRRVGDAARRAEQTPPQPQHLVDVVLSEHLVDGLGRAEEALEPLVRGLG